VAEALPPACEILQKWNLFAVDSLLVAELSLKRSVRSYPSDIKRLEFRLGQCENQRRRIVDPLPVSIATKQGVKPMIVVDDHSFVFADKNIKLQTVNADLTRGLKSGQTIFRRKTSSAAMPVNGDRR